MIVETNVKNAAYQWYAKYGLDGGMLFLIDNERYSGMTTDHFKLKTSDSLATGTGWENIYFACMVTAPDGRTAITNGTSDDSSAPCRYVQELR